MDATQPARGMRSPPVQYRLNRRAAAFLSGVFLLLGGVTAVICCTRLDPMRQLAALRDSAKSYVQRQEWRQAALQLANVVRLDPTDTGAWFDLGSVQLRWAATQPDDSTTRAEGLRAATTCFRRVLELDPSHRAARRWILELDVRGGNWTDAREHARLLVKRIPGDPLVTLAWELLPTQHPNEIGDARRLLAGPKGKEHSVVALLAPLHHKEPLDFEALTLLAVAKTRLGDQHGRDATLASAAKLLGASARLDCVRAECAVHDGNLNAAAEWATSAKRVAHVETPARRLLADIHRRRALRDPACAFVHWQRALAEYRAILQLVPGDQQAANNAAWLLGRCLGRREEALSTSAAALAQTEHPAPALLDTHGQLLLASNRPTDAARFLDRSAVAVAGTRRAPSAALAPADADPISVWRAWTKLDHQPR